MAPTKEIGSYSPSTPGNFEWRTSLAYSSLDGSAHLSYYDPGKQRLMYAHVSRSGQLDTKEIDSGGVLGVGFYNSLALNSRGLPRIAYQDQTGKHLRYAYGEEAH